MGIISGRLLAGVALVFIIVVCVTVVLNTSEHESGEATVQVLPNTTATIHSCSDNLEDPSQTTGPNSISMRESSSLLGPSIRSKTFALAVSDLSGDGKDDILISAHENNPYLYVNTGSGFANKSRALFSHKLTYDRHGYTLVDLDNDGDLDIAIAGGGAGGVGKGEANLFFENVSEKGEVKFNGRPVGPEIALPTGRGRSLLPLASSDGKSVDLYYTALSRKGYPNLLLRNTSLPDHFSFAADEDFFASKAINDRGRGTFADFNGDGKNDYLVVEGGTAKIVWQAEAASESMLLSDQVTTAKAADFNNDGALDVYVGRSSPATNSDRVNYGSEELAYFVANHGVDDSSAISFQTQSDSLSVNLKQYIPPTSSERLRGSGHIFIGSELRNPQSRKFPVSKDEAAGEPEQFNDPGIYIWYEVAKGRWHIKWIFHVGLKNYKGFISSVGIASVATTGFTTLNPEPISDELFINDGKGNFSKLCQGAFGHSLHTAGATIADFNNDGWLDIIAVRQGEGGALNGDIFVLTNLLGSSFSQRIIPMRDGDRLRRADLIAHGFINTDRMPDIVTTNGYGQLPGSQGSARLLLNNSPGQLPALLVQLEGTSANKYAVGAKLTLSDAQGVTMGYRVQGLNANVSQDTQWVHFGLGSVLPPYILNIEWPDGVATSHAFTEPGTVRIKQ